MLSGMYFWMISGDFVGRELRLLTITQKNANSYRGENQNQLVLKLHEVYAKVFANPRRASLMLKIMPLNARYLTMRRKVLPWDAPGCLLVIHIVQINSTRGRGGSRRK